LIYRKKHDPPEGFINCHNSQRPSYEDDLISESQIHSILEQTLTNTIAQTENHRFKLALNIILILSSHPKKDIRAFSFGKLYEITPQKQLKKLIIEDLKELINDSELNVSIAAQNSLEFIYGSMDGLILADYISDIFSSFCSDFKNQAIISIHHIQSSFHPLTKHSPFQTKVHPHNRFFTALVRRYRQINIILDKTLFSNELEELIPELAEVENFYLEDLFEEEIIPYTAIANSEWKPMDSIEKIANIYSYTFLEEGHLEHLKTYLDDDDYHIRHIGANALLKVAEFLFNFSDDEFIEHLNQLKTQNFQEYLETPAK
jgi:hypothetical protein